MGLSSTPYWEPDPLPIVLRVRAVGGRPGTERGARGSSDTGGGRELAPAAANSCDAVDRASDRALRGIPAASPVGAQARRGRVEAWTGPTKAAHDFRWATSNSRRRRRVANAEYTPSMASRSSNQARAAVYLLFPSSSPPQALAGNRWLNSSPTPTVSRNTGSAINSVALSRRVRNPTAWSPTTENRSSFAPYGAHRGGRQPSTHHSLGHRRRSRDPKCLVYRTCVSGSTSRARIARWLGEVRSMLPGGHRCMSTCEQSRPDSRRLSATRPRTSSVRDAALKPSTIGVFVFPSRSRAAI